jgi:signal transduction histidine kinase
MIGIIKKINTWNKRYLSKKGYYEEDSLNFLLEKYILIVIETLFTVLLIANIINLINAFNTGYYIHVIINVFFLTLFYLLLIEKKLKTSGRALFLIVLIYIKSIGLILVGFFEQALLFLFIFSISTAIFLDIKHAFVSVITNFITVLLFCSLYYLTDIFQSIYLHESTYKYIVISINFVVINSIFTIVTAYFFVWLKSSFHREIILKQKLKRKSERLIEAKMKAEESDQLKSSFLANISHEFRTPMNAIMGFTEIMLYTDPDKDKCKKYLNNIYKSGEQLLQIIHNTIEYSKIELGTIEFDKSVFSIVELLDTLLEQLQHRCPKNVEYKVFVDEELLTQRIYTDKEKLFQIFSNLILNAFKFTHEGEVSFGISNSNDKEYFHFFVKDTGIGIRKEKQKDIFNRFHKEDDFKEGTGLGLSISATLVFHLGGKIWLESVSGKGTIFYFIIPRIKKEDIK